jgi:hypothetical protein
MGRSILASSKLSIYGKDSQNEAASWSYMYMY